MSALTRAQTVVPDAPCGPVITDWTGARHALALAWIAVTGQMRLPSPPELVTARIDALEGIRRVEQTMPLDGSAGYDAVARLEAALGLLRGNMPTRELIRNAADAIIHLGFDRALVSSVHEGRWVPQWMSDPRDPAWGEQILEVGRADQRPLDGRLIESELGVRRSEILVRDAQRDPRVHDRLARISLAHSYIAVPLMADGLVIGILHADCYYQRREPDELARKLLRVFAEVFTQAVLRSTTADHLAVIESEIRRLSASIPGMNQCTQHTITANVQPRVSSDDDQVKSRALTSRFRLTKRQVEVLELVAKGYTNATIGTSLY